MAKESLQLCTKCLLPETHETITFDATGLCSVCSNSQVKSTIDWRSRQSELDQIARDTKSLGGNYDCVIPFSGGKDSTFSLYYVVKVLKLKPLVASFDHGFYRDVLLDNRNKVLKKLGVDFVSFTPNWHLVKQLMLASLRDKGDFCWHCHTGVNSFPMRTAVEKNIPLVIWGESSTEYTNYYKTDQFHQIDEELFNRITNLGISAEDMLMRLEGNFELRDLFPFTFPSSEEIKSRGIRSFPLGNYIEWDTQKQVDLIKSELEWQGDQVEGVPSAYDYEKIECMMQGSRDYLKYRKRGYARTTHLTSIDIRNGKLERETGKGMVSEFEDKRPHSLQLFMDLIGLTEEELETILEQQLIDPWDGKIPVKIGSKPHDYDNWVKKLLVN
jgi:N-acetyl sugar amidotransferase